MVLHPDALKRAQEEIDLVVGPDRLPTFSDRKDLPYIEALVQETLRWENVGPVSESLYRAFRLYISTTYCTIFI